MGNIGRGLVLILLCFSCHLIALGQQLSEIIENRTALQ